MNHLFKTMLLLFISINLSMFSQQSIAEASGDNHLLNIQQQWAKVNYQLVADEQERGFEQLLMQIESLVKRQPENANNLVWLGIIQSSFAGAKGGLGALSLAKSAKISFEKSLEKSLKIDDKTLQSSAYASLGTLYHQVPGWPIGFGDDDIAIAMLEKAILLNEDGIDSNYFYAKFWFEERKYAKAKKYLMKAQQAPARATRPLADESRHKEIHQLMVKVDKKLKKKKKV